VYTRAGVRRSADKWGRGAAGSAPHWQCGGQGFESPRLHPFPQVSAFFHQYLSILCSQRSHDCSHTAPHCVRTDCVQCGHGGGLTRSVAALRSTGVIMVECGTPELVWCAKCRCVREPPAPLAHRMGLARVWCTADEFSGGRRGRRRDVHDQGSAPGWPWVRVTATAVTAYCWRRHHRAPAWPVVHTPGAPHRLVMGRAHGARRQRWPHGCLPRRCSCSEWPVAISGGPEPRSVGGNLATVSVAACNREDEGAPTAPETA
jgi:hypothetical protein